MRIIQAQPRHTRVYRWPSTADQIPDHQIDALIRASVEEMKIYVETASGAKVSREKTVPHQPKKAAAARP